MKTTMGMTNEARKRADEAEQRAELQRQKKERSRDPDLEVIASKADRIVQKGKVNYDSLEEAFPVADPCLEPFGSDVIVQLRTPKRQTSGGILLSDETRAVDADNTQVAKVIAIGPVAFHNRETLEMWPEGPWAAPGDYVRVPKYGGDRWLSDAPGSIDGKAVFLQINDLDLKGRIPEDKVLNIVAYI
jgi:co-chaperonin GroES (HSP10)